MKSLLLLSAIALFSTSAFAGTLEEDVKYLSDAFAGNGNGSYVRTYDLAKLDIASVAKAMYADRADNGCYSPVIKIVEPEYLQQSELKSHAVKITKGMIAVENDGGADGGPEEVKKMSAIVRKLLSDKSNKLVVSSEFDYANPDSSEGCLVFKYDIYRADGKLVEIEFNHTD